ncbi:hypothetical protein BVG16_20775 [Paenibacillus selenitireducens]|uniref:HTH tetR-type domain-containing protein n=1 Tax=Paenibacillus selenitireducens TaxID=1324314 RepID=A0A1T2X7G3_9BACL|nr:TetR/AcrR family transcriptional regulator [Paenibacillus selenitireducens]OPA75765.1 hypothetical protein BVG16_20775 [Paenibacillus selenitireducens]
MVTSQRILQVALEHFAKHGYSGASLSKIAEEVGIKKPSIYAHFKGKDDLFLQVLDYTLREEFQATIQYLKQHRQDSLHDCLYGVLALQLNRYEESVSMMFMLRVSFIPPMNLHEQVMHRFNAHLEEWEHELNHTLQAACDAGELQVTDPNQVTTAYLCLCDGVLTELLYSGKPKAFKRLDASWIYFWRGITST